MDGARLAELREERGLSQTEFGEKFTLSQDTISNYERNKTSPDDDIKIAFATFFNVSIDYLMGVSKERRPIRETGGMFLYCDNLPQQAKEELVSFLNYLRERYHL